MSQQSTTNGVPSHMMPRTPMQAPHRTTAVRGRSKERARHHSYNGPMVLAFLFGFCLAQCAPVALAHMNQPLPPDYTAAACYGLVQNAGRAIAWARWEKGLSLEKTRSAPFRASTPGWGIDLVKGWIDDAYQWRATDQQIRQWAAELGSVDDLPSAEALSVHEKIAIWMRRIGRQCDERDVHAGTSAKLTGGNISFEQ
jgi:hypothetical protein